MEQTPLQKQLSELKKKQEQKPKKPKQKFDFTDSDFILDELENIDEEGF